MTEIINNTRSFKCACDCFASDNNGAYLPGTTTFDRKLWRNRALVVTIDSAAKFHLLSSDGTLLDARGTNLLSPESMVWEKHPPELRQPDPRQ